MRAGLVLAVVLASIAGVVFWLMRRESTREAASAVPAASATVETPARSSDAPSAVVGDEAPTRIEAADARSAVATEPATRPTPARTAGHALTGRLVDARGQPIASATVLAANDRGFPGGPLDAEGGMMDAWVERHRATTDDQGRFELSGPQPGTLRMSFRASGFAPLDRSNVAFPAGEAKDLGSITLEDGVWLGGRVVDSAGRGVAGARILRLGADDPNRVVIFSGRMLGVPVATTNADGTFEIDQLEAGPYRLLTVTADHPDQETRGETERAGERVNGLRIELEDGAEIAGRVVGAPAGVASTMIAQAWPQAPSDDRDRSFAPSEVREAAVDANGAFAIRGARPGVAYSVSAGSRRPGRGWMQTMTPRVKTQAGARDVELAYQPETALVFQVKDRATGEPLSRFDVRVGTPWPMPLIDEQGRLRREFPDGRVRFGNLRADGEESAALEIEAAGFKTYRQEGIALVNGVEQDLGVIFLDPAPLVVVRVTDASTGEPLDGALVTLSEHVPDTGEVRRTIVIGGGGGDEPEISVGESRRERTDSTGVARLSSYEGRTCVIGVRHKGHAPYTSAPIDLPAGAPFDHAVALSRGGSVLVTVLDAAGNPLGGKRVGHRSGAARPSEFPELGGGSPVSGDDGTALFENLEAGTHSFRIAPDRGGMMFGGDVSFHVATPDGPREEGWVDVEVAEGQRGTLTLTAPLELAIHGRVREAGEALAGATLTLRKKRGGANDPIAAALDMGAPSTKADSRGEYRFDEVEEGEYTLVVGHATRAMPSEIPVVVRGSDLRQDVELPLAIVEGRARDADGKPMANVEVWAERATEGTGPRRMVMRAVSMGAGDMTVDLGGGAQAARARTDEEGRYQLRGVETDVDLVVKARGKGLQPVQSDRLRVAPDQTKDGVDLSLALGGSIDVRVLGPDGKPKGECLLTARFEGKSDSPVTPETRFVDDSGATELDGLRPGPWRLSVRELGGMVVDTREASAIPEQTVDVVAGEAKNAQFTRP